MSLSVFTCQVCPTLFLRGHCNSRFQCGGPSSTLTLYSPDHRTGHRSFFMSSNVPNCVQQHRRQSRPSPISRWKPNLTSSPPCSNDDNISGCRAAQTPLAYALNSTRMPCQPVCVASSNPIHRASPPKRSSAVRLSHATLRVTVPELSEQNSTTCVIGSERPLPRSPSLAIPPPPRLAPAQPSLHSQPQALSQASAAPCPPADRPRSPCPTIIRS